MMFVSIIVPVYNVEKYLAKCIQSVLCQSYPDFEVLLIDDGSEDGSGDLCDLWSQSDSRIKAYHKENGGLSDARNYGIDRAEGEYITFIDSDDYIGRDYLKILVELVREYGTQIACVSSSMVLENGTERSGGVNDERGYINTEDALKYMCTRKYFGVSAWGKLYKAELFAHIRYPKGRIYEDLLTTPYLIALSDFVSYSSSQQYFWVQRIGSITHTCHSEKETLSHFEALKELIAFIDKKYREIHGAAVCRYVEDSFHSIHNMVYNREYAERIKNIMVCAKAYWIEGLRNPYVRKTRKIEIILMLISPCLYRMVYKTWKNQTAIVEQEGKNGVRHDS